MKSLLYTLILLFAFAACSKDDKPEQVDLTKYPLYNTKWVYFDEKNELDGHNDYYVFKKEDGILYNFLFINNKYNLYELKVNYTYKKPNITVQLETQKDNPPKEGYIENDTLYFDNSKYYKEK